MSANSPNPSNYTLGKGVLYFDQFDDNGNLTGERDLGNAPELQFNMSVDMLDHFSSRSGISSKDKQVTKMITPTFTFSLDEFSDENLSMLFYGDMADSVQAAASNLSAVLPTAVKPAHYYDLGKRKIGGYKVVVAYEAGKTATDLPDDAVVTNTSGGATNTWQVITAIGTNVYLKNKAGTGLAAGDVYVGTTKIATIAAAPVFAANSIIIKEGSAYFESGTEFTVDAALGRILIGAATTMVGGGTAFFSCEAETVSKINAVTNRTLKGKIRFVSDNPEGSQYSFQAWNCSLKPNGDTAFISDTWAAVKFTCEILLDKVNHPDSPYMEIIVS